MVYLSRYEGDIGNGNRTVFRTEDNEALVDVREEKEKKRRTRKIFSGPTNGHMTWILSTWAAGSETYEFALYRVFVDDRKVIVH